MADARWSCTWSTDVLSVTKSSIVPLTWPPTEGGTNQNNNQTTTAAAMETATTTSTTSPTTAAEKRTTTKWTINLLAISVRKLSKGLTPWESISLLFTKVPVTWIKMVMGQFSNTPLILKIRPRLVPIHPQFLPPAPNTALLSYSARNPNLSSNFSADFVLRVYPLWLSYLST